MALSPVLPISSALDLAIPALCPLLALVVDDAPVRRIELGGALADWSHLAELRRDHDRFQHRAVAVILQHHELDFRLEQPLDEAGCERRGVGLSDRTSGRQQRDRAFLWI